MLSKNKISPKGAPRTSCSKARELKYLSSWKEIANYMGKGVRTVQRYESQLGLPVRRPAGKSRAAVLAMREEIDAWIESSPVREALENSVQNILEKDPELIKIRRGISEMHELRRQMNALRAETSASMGLLLAGVRTLIKSTRARTPNPDETVEAAIRTRRMLSERWITGGRTN